jgi:hypothetical protein
MCENKDQLKTYLRWTESLWCHIEDFGHSFQFCDNVDTVSGWWHLVAEVCMGPGLGLVAQIMFSFGLGLGLVQMITIMCYIEHYRLSWAILFFCKGKVICSCTHLVLATVRLRNKSHWLDFLRDFRSCLLPDIVPDNILQTWHPISLCHSSNARITSDVLRALLNN